MIRISPEVYAHSANSKGEMHDLIRHLKRVAQISRDFAAKFGADELGYYAGLWHDLGKFHPDFQAYLNDPEGKRRPDHASAGAVLSILDSKIGPILAYPIAGHHGGLTNKVELKNWLYDKKNKQEIKEAIDLALKYLPGQPNLVIPPRLNQPHQCELFIRMLFSCLVDADYLDTEAHFNPERAKQRGRYARLSDLWEKFEDNQEKFEDNQAKQTDRYHDRLNTIRHEIYLACLKAAESSQGIFRLTVPTGGGKTRSGMAFALRHSLKHNLDRVIVAIPYTSIIDQTADIYREIFGAEVVLEHHSAVDSEDEKARLASENWDAPIIVTTTLQLFESLFANRSSRCRKLHNISRSVLILDEVQTLPTELLTPILDVLQDLSINYRVTVVLCTATQPAVTDPNSPYLKGLSGVREIIPNPGQYFKALKRVSYEIPQNGETWTWLQVAEEMKAVRQSLAVVNTKKDALTLLDTLDDPDALHLSTLLCGAHRQEVLKEVRERLENNKPCHLVSTQVVEAGVDIDFPVVLRAIGPLDRIIQSAGRCNREGRLKEGRVIIFVPEEGGIPPGDYRTATDETIALLSQKVDMDDPALYEEYFRRLYQDVVTDKKNIQEQRKGLNYKDVAERFQMIDGATIPVVVYYHPDKVAEILEEFKHGHIDWRVMIRRLQPYLVSVYEYQLPQLQREQLIQELSPGLWEWKGGYDSIRGLTKEALDPDKLIF